MKLKLLAIAAKLGSVSTLKIKRTVLCDGTLYASYFFGQRERHSIQLWSAVLFAYHVMWVKACRKSKNIIKLNFINY